ncbi:thiamine phosphate synthase [Novosphingobium resinovorum]|uniref:thiamine phosphate synthase n=1 Tax=Novosphingobium TaxID=165696 RepID=UPI001B3C592D|nr:MULTISPECIES: thiamine phosphate synthase [Novosphingobium]MBF7012619.1 thiamine phosphate synthase [Novosphingobium sp. HR1a]WJM27352.1 thiamine phosphate synthase [Novosphingobium resinovorum]
MARCYSVLVKNRQPSLPKLWLISDARNDARLEHALARLPRGSGLVFRHYHLSPEARQTRFDALLRLARRHGHRTVLAGDTALARRWRADGVYASPERLGRKQGVLRLATVHSLRELAIAHRTGADAVLVSPVFPTASHPGAQTLGAVGLKLLSARARVPVIALGGMTRHRARTARIARWAAIDGLS